MSDTLQIFKNFTNICLKQDLEAIIEFCKNKEAIDIIREQFKKEEDPFYEEDYILNDTFKEIYKTKEGRQFIKDLISNEKINNELSIFFIETLITFANNNEEINDLINDEKISKIIKDNIITFKESNIYDNILIFTSFYSYYSNYEFFTIKILENENIIEELLKSSYGESVINTVFCYSANNQTSLLANDIAINIRLVEKILENENITKKLYDNENFNNFFMAITEYKYRKCFDIFFNDTINDKISKDSINSCFHKCIEKERIDILEKLINSKLVDKIDNSEIESALNYLFENNKQKIIKLLTNKDVILKKITHIQESDKLIKIFETACNNKNEDTVRILSCNKKIVEKIGKNKIEEGIEKISFLTICNYDDISVAEEYIISKPNILTEKIVSKLNEDKTPLLYNILNRDSFNEKDIKIAEILIAKGVKINNTSKLVRRNINKIVESLKKENCNIKKQHFGIINKKKLKRTEEAIEKIKEFIDIKKLIDDVSTINSVNNNEKTIN